MIKKRQSITKTLVITFILIVFTVGFIAYCTFSYVTKYIRDEIPTDKISISVELDQTTIEEKMENIFGIIGTRMIFLVIATLIVGILLLVATGLRVIKPLQKLSDAINEVSAGNFDIEIKKTRNDEIGDLTDQFNKMVKELRKVDYLQKDFISNVSHEFKTPITSIQGYVDLLDDPNLTPEERKEYTAIIKEETTRLTNLTTNALRLSRIDNRVEQENEEQYSLDEQIRKCILLLEKNWSEKNIKFNLKLDNVTIFAEKELLEQVWINLISNAIKFSYDSGKITIISKQVDQNAIVTIKDEGIGIAEDKIDRIFDKFYQVDSSHAQNGSGLGLAITKRIVKLCNGEISVQSKLGKGTEFTVKLPAFEKKQKIENKN